jgi:cyclopropane fatty-acyl-phospholipid synthase-like methyltransferase
MRMFAGCLPGARVLVPGCGDGQDSRYLTSLGLDVLSFDLSDGMLEEARKLDARGQYEKLDLRNVASLARTFDGVYASGCLYHLRRGEFKTFVRDIYAMLVPRGVFYVSMKIGRGEGYRAVPGHQYPGGEQARQLLQGDRYYAYYQRQELARYLRSYQLLRERPLQHAEEVFELWLSKGPEANR